MGVVFVDTNCLILFIAGSVDRRSISMVERIEFRTIREYLQLIDLIGLDDIAVTPHVVTETSNLLRQTKREPLRSRLIEGLARLCVATVEQSLASADAVGLAAYRPLGVTDAVLLHLAVGHRIITVDQSLWREAMRRGIDAVNLDHYR